MADKTYPDYTVIDPNLVQELVQKASSTGFDIEDKYSNLADEFAIMSRWNKANLRPSKFFYINQEIIEAIEQHVSPTYKYTALNSFTPPCGGTTVTDFIQYTNQTIKDKLASNQAKLPSRNTHARKDEIKLAPGYPEANYFRQYYSQWSADVVVEKSFPKSTDKNAYTYRNNRTYLVKLLTLDFSPWGPQTNYGREVILLNDWLYGAAKNIKLSFLEFLEEYESDPVGEEWTKLRKQVADYQFIDHGGASGHGGLFQRLVVPLLNGSIISWYGRPTKYRNFILTQERQVLIQAFTDYQAFSSKGYQSLEEYIANCKRKLGVDIESLSEARSGKEIAMGLSKVLYGAGQRINNTYNPDRAQVLNLAAFMGFPKADYFSKSAMVWTKILNILESDEVRDKIGFEEYAAFLFAVTHPTSWIRGSHDNTAFILGEMMEKGGALPTIALISDIVVDTHCRVPTESEWRNSIGTIDFEVGTAFLLPLVVKQYDENTRPMSKDLKDLRRSLKRNK